MPGRRDEDRWAKWDKRIRDTILFTIGVAGVVNELFVLDSPRATALVFLGSLIGLPFALLADERRRQSADQDDA